MYEAPKTLPSRICWTRFNRELAERHGYDRALLGGVGLPGVGVVPQEIAKRRHLFHLGVRRRDHVRVNPKDSSSTGVSTFEHRTFRRPRVGTPLAREPESEQSAGDRGDIVGIRGDLQVNDVLAFEVGYRCAADVLSAGPRNRVFDQTDELGCGGQRPPVRGMRADPRIRPGIKFLSDPTHGKSVPEMLLSPSQ